VAVVSTTGVPDRHDVIGTLAAGSLSHAACSSENGCGISLDRSIFFSALTE